MAAYINKQGGTRSTRLNALAAGLWTWCRRRDIIPIASYSPGQDKLIADFLSRGRIPPSEWTLHSQVMATIFRTFGPLHVDLFASALYAQLQRYCAQALDPAVWRIEPSQFGGRDSRGTPFPRPHPPNSTEGEAGSGYRPPHCPVVAEENVVPRNDNPSSGVSGDVDNYRGVVPHVVDKEARSLLFNYMGDLYRDATDTIGEPSHGAGSELGGWYSAPNTGLFTDAPRCRLGINLPSEFATEYSRMDKTNDFKAVPRGSYSTFLFNDPGQSQFFGPKRLAPDTVAFSNSLRDPVSVNKSPLDSREFKRDFSLWSFVDRASSLAGRLAIYSAALTDILIRAVELEVSEEDLITVRALILEISAMQFSQAAHLRLFAPDRNCAFTLNSLGLTDRMNISAAVRIPRDGEFLFSGKFLDGVDSDISMHKRAREVAGRIAKPRFSDASRRQRFRPATSFSSRGRAQPFRARGRGFRRPVRGRGAAYGRGTPVWSAASASNRK